MRFVAMKVKADLWMVDFKTYAAPTDWDSMGD
jgi:hypothetical protein